MQIETKRKILKIVIVSALLTGFLALLILNCCNYNFKINCFNHFVAEGRVEFFNVFFKIFTYLGSAYLMVTFLLIMFLVSKKSKRQVFIAICIFALVSCLGLLIKYLVKSPRPEIFMVVEEVGYSFPSGHAVMISSFAYLFLSYVNPKIKNQKLKIAFDLFIAGLVLLVGFSRIYLGVHYLTDVIAGYCFGLGLTMLLNMIMGVFERRKNE